jgi:hypothetical protein
MQQVTLRVNKKLPHFIETAYDTYYNIISLLFALDCRHHRRHAGHGRHQHL